MTHRSLGPSVPITEEFVKQELASLGPDASHDWWWVLILPTALGSRDVRQHEEQHIKMSLVVQAYLSC